MLNIPKIKSLAKNKGWSLSYLCSQLGLSNSYFVDVKNGKSKVPEWRIEEIANLLDTTPEYLKDETNIKEKPTANNGDELTEYLEELKNRSEMRMLFKTVRGATKKDVEAAVRIIEALKDRNGRNNY
ncbi:MAG: helix-turn-helix transcriptional regulator [Bacillota bacterium]|nr:helix-turn-helix transcriptional regulator [Bacillota bacterium]